MKRPNFLIIGASALAVVCMTAAHSAHADDSDNRALLNRITELEEQVHTLSQRSAASASPYAGSAALGPSGGGNINTTVNAPDLETRLGSLETQMRNLTGQIEQTNYQNQQTNAALQKMSSDVDFRLQQMEQRQATAANNAGVPTTSTGMPIAPVGDPNAPITNSTTATLPPAAAVIDTNPQKAAVNQDAPASPEELYNKAYSEMQRKEYAAAQTDFKSFLATNQGSKLAPNAEYWLGEIYYAQGNYKLASATFADGYQKAPKGSKAPDNLLKLGLSLEQQNRTKDSCTVLNQLLKDFPSAAETTRTAASKGVKRMKCS